MNVPMELRLAESEARRVRAVYPEDRLLRALVALDLVIRRVAYGVIRFDAFASSLERREHAARRSPCRS